MTREELKEHCEKQIEMCEMWAISRGKKPSGKIYEEHKLILELLEQEPCEDVVSRCAVLIELDKYLCGVPFDEKGIDEVIKDLPSVMVRPKKGHWIKIGAYQGKCSRCNNCVIDEDENFGDYCRHCGSDMRGD